MPGRISALQTKPGRSNRVRVFLDGRYAFSLTAVLAAGLAVGQVLDEAAVERLSGRETEEQAYQRGLRLISRRPRSEQELRAYYDRQRTPPGVRQAAMERLRQAGLLDDAGFARYWVENRQAFRPKSAAALRAELRRKGVDADGIRAAVDGLDEQAAADQAARQGARRLRGLEPDEFRRRLEGYLARRGFDFAIIRPAVSRAWAELSGPDVESEDESWRHRM